jgi:hypothetical protein
MYAWIGKTVVRFALRRYRRQAGIAVGLGVAAVAAAAAYLLTREVPEG